MYALNTYLGKTKTVSAKPIGFTSIVQIKSFFVWGFTLCKVGKPLQGRVLQEEKEEKDKKHLGKLFRKDLKIKCQVTSDLKAFRL